MVFAECLEWLMHMFNGLYLAHQPVFDLMAFEIPILNQTVGVIAFGGSFAAMIAFRIVKFFV